MNKRILAMVVAVLLMLSCGAALADGATSVPVTFVYRDQQGAFSYYVHLKPDLALVPNTDMTIASATFDYGISNVTGIANEGTQVALSFVYTTPLTADEATLEGNSALPSTFKYQIYSDSGKATSHNSGVTVATYSATRLNELYNSHASDLLSAYIEAELPAAFAGINIVELNYNINYVGKVTLNVAETIGASTL